MSLFVEDNFWIFLIMTVIFGGGAAFMSGRSQAAGWRPMWHGLAFMVLLGAALRFLHFALFGAELLSLHYFLTDTLVLMLACALGYRMTLAGQMVRQYPWLYERAGPLAWRNKA